MITYTLGLLLTLSPPVVNDDRDVIQAAMLSYFTELKPGELGPKHQVILRTQFFSKDRPDFPMACKGVRSSCQSDLDALTRHLKYENYVRPERKQEDKVAAQRAKKDLAALTLVKANVSSGSDSVPPALIPLKSMGWDRRIILTDRSNYGRIEEKDRDKSLEADTVYAQSTRPCYSRNGRYAIVSLWIPCYIHVACNTFLFERRAKGWKLLVEISTMQL